jgi:hypothetical protein
MHKRWLAAGLIYMVLGLPIIYMIGTSEDQQPWLNALAVYFVLSALIGNWYVPFGWRFDVPTLLKWLAINTLVFGLILVGYLHLVGAIDINRL